MKNNRIEVASKTIGSIRGAIMSLILTATALLLVFQGYVANQEYEYTMKNCEIVESEVVESNEVEVHTKMEKRRSKKTRRKVTEYKQDVQVSYYYDGVNYTKSFYNIPVSSRDGMKKGDKVTLYVDRNDPSNAKEKSDVSDGVFLYIIAGVIGLIDFMVIFNVVRDFSRLFKKGSGDYNGISN